jgi:hypothetical protein
MYPDRTLRAALLFTALGACPSTQTPTPDAARPDASPDAAPDVAPDAPEPKDVAPPPDMPPAASGIGDACESDEMFGQGTCRAGQICITGRLGYRNGYCTQVCTGASRCPGDATCTQLQGFPVCLRRCATNADCRAEDGYVCTIGSAMGQRVCNVNDAPVGRRTDGTACFTDAGGAHPAPALARRAFAMPNFSVSAARRDTVVNAEGNVAVHPMNGNVASSYIASGMGSSFMGVSLSSNGGMGFDAWGSVMDPLGSASDPVLDYGRDGVLRMTFIGLQRTNLGQVQRSTVRITESTDAGRTWATPRQVEPNNYCPVGGICDKPWLVSGPALMGDVDSLYIGYLRAASNAADLVVQRSDDRGMTWAAPIVAGRAGVVGTTATQPNLVQFATGGPGVVGATWIGLAAGMAAGQDGAVRFGSSDNRVYFRRSVDGFRTMESLRIVSRRDDAPVYVQAPVAIDGNTVHVAYVSGDSTGAWDIILATSTDNGATWSHRQVNDDPERCASHHFPSMVVDRTTHDVHVIWMENRFGDGAVAYARCPANAAMRCGTNEQVSDMSFTFTSSRSPNIWHGDYNGLTIAANGDLWATWSDTRTGRPQMYVARGRGR